jgi:hypothetical protein
MPHVQGNELFRIWLETAIFSIDLIKKLYSYYIFVNHQITIDQPYSFQKKININKENTKTL